MVSEII